MPLEILLELIDQRRPHWNWDLPVRIQVLHTVQRIDWSHLAPVCIRGALCWRAIFQCAVNEAQSKRLENALWIRDQFLHVDPIWLVGARSGGIRHLQGTRCKPSQAHDCGPVCTISRKFVPSHALRFPILVHVEHDLILGAWLRPVSHRPIQACIPIVGPSELVGCPGCRTIDARINDLVPTAVNQALEGLPAILADPNDRGEALAIPTHGPGLPRCRRARNVKGASTAVQITYTCASLVLIVGAELPSHLFSDASWANAQEDLELCAGEDVLTSSERIEAWSAHDPIVALVLVVGAPHNVALGGVRTFDARVQNRVPTAILEDLEGLPFLQADS
mmetsp:Transcript_174486/g.559352  ORF Transcript_174486/g.559352 Transcript_174486/m.559352 type:complete len:335 (-) Transcript_174486:183-1187(-)